MNRRFFPRLIPRILLALLLVVSASAATAQENAACEPGLRRVEHELLAEGHACVPENPQRIIAHYYASEMVALSVPMIATNYVNAELVLTPEQLEGVTDLGMDFNPNVEQVLSLDPDLIFVPDFVEPGVVDQLAEIAPTVVVPYSGDPFERLRLFGELTGHPEAANAWIEAYEAKAEALSAEAASYIEEGETASAFIMYGDDQLYVYGYPRLGFTLYDVFGFEVPAGVAELFQDDPDTLWASISLELLPEYVGDRIFLVQGSDEASQEANQELINDPIWQSLPVVQNGDVYFVNTRWALNDPLTLDWLLDEMAAVLIPSEATPEATEAASSE